MIDPKIAFPELNANQLKLLERYVAEQYRKGYNDNARDCTCAMLPIAPHHHLMDDGASHPIRPVIATLKQEAGL